ncbi:hypothetical protein ACFO3J_09910 [Streptomyces polygonati]|uniref:Uncharacterized protein n=1 Tax=Streptomyces polygonati TaxID=1617087 RepID=A0ABV8HIC6_9ACTN
MTTPPQKPPRKPPQQGIPRPEARQDTTARRTARREPAPVGTVLADRPPPDETPAAVSRAEPGSVRHSVTLLGGIGVAAVLLLALTDGAAAAALGAALLTAAGLFIARYAVGGGAQDSGYRRSVKLLGTRAPALGEWEWIVGRGLGPDSDVYVATTVRPQLERLFAARLAERHGVDARRDPRRARALVGAELWPWIDPSGPPPASALTEPVLRALLDRLEALDTPTRPVADEWAEREDQTERADRTEPGRTEPAEHAATHPDQATGHRDQAE